MKPGNKSIFIAKVRKYEKYYLFRAFFFSCFRDPVLFFTIKHAKIINKTLNDLEFFMQDWGYIFKP